MGKTILVVEDNELNLRLFCDLLNAHGYSAHPVRDGRDALDKARELTPDLIIMDIQLPHVSGLELIGQMKADLMLREVPIMAVTAYAGKGDDLGNVRSPPQSGHRLQIRLSYIIRLCQP